MALTTEQIIKTAHEAGLYQDGINTQLPLWVLTQQELERFARTIEAEVRKQDDALIRQMLEALKQFQYRACESIHPDFVDEAITAGRARLGEKT